MKDETNSLFLSFNDGESLCYNNERTIPNLTYTLFINK